MKSNCSCTRRHLLQLSWASLPLVALPGCWSVSQGPSPENASGPSAPREWNSRVLSLQGEAVSSGKSLSVGDVVENKKEMEVSAGSRVILGLPDQSTLEVQSESRLTVALQDEGGELLLKKGRLTAAIVQNRQRRYRLRMPAVEVGVRGTVFHAETDWLGDPGKAYYCLCFGEAVFQNEQGSRLLSLKTRDHSAFEIRQTGPAPLFAPTNQMASHSNPQIVRLLQTGEVPHEQEWLR